MDKTILGNNKTIYNYTSLHAACDSKDHYNVYGVCYMDIYVIICYRIVVCICTLIYLLSLSLYIGCY